MKTRTPTLLVMCQVWWQRPVTGSQFLGDVALLPRSDQGLSLWPASPAGVMVGSAEQLALLFFLVTQGAYITQMPGGGERKCEGIQASPPSAGKSL